MKRTLLTVCSVAALFAAGCATPGKYKWVDQYADETADAQGYALAPGDIISVRVLNHDEASANRVRVRTDGKVSLPMLSDVDVLGRTPQQVAEGLKEKLTPFVPNAVVTVTLDEMRPFTISVMGEVVKPGVYPLEPGSGVLHALASAGGLNPYAHEDGIYVLRRSPSTSNPERIRFDYAALSRAEGKAPGFRLRGSDVIVVE